MSDKKALLVKTASESLVDFINGEMFRVSEIDCVPAFVITAISVKVAEPDELLHKGQRPLYWMRLVLFLE
jgi:hypothetical protein